MTTIVDWRGEEWLRQAIPSINKGLTAAAAVMADQASQLLNGPSPSAPGSPPGNDTGLLHNSIRFVSPESLGTNLKAAFGTAVPYGRHLEFGAVISAKNTKYLPVPVDRALAATMRRRSSKGLSSGLFGYSGGSSVRSIPGLKYIPPAKGANNGGRLVLESSARVNVRGPKKKTRGVSAGKTVFVLKKQVTIKAHPWIRRAAESSASAASAMASRVCIADLEAKGLMQ